VEDFCPSDYCPNQEGGTIVPTGDSMWYVIRTKRYKEQLVKQTTSSFAEDVYLPLLRTKKRCLGKLIEVTEPLFPCYLFSRLRLNEGHYRLVHTPGVSGIVCAGGEPCVVDASIVQDIRSRETNGIIVLNPRTLRPPQRVTITYGAFRGIEAVFERYLSGAERVAVLMDSIGRGNLRVILRTDAIVPQTAS
jgi:transcriptional antiterminator RfaH